MFNRVKPTPNSNAIISSADYVSEGLWALKVYENLKMRRPTLKNPNVVNAFVSSYLRTEYAVFEQPRCYPRAQSPEPQTLTQIQVQQKFQTTSPTKCTKRSRIFSASPASASSNLAESASNRSPVRRGSAIGLALQIQRFERTVDCLRPPLEFVVR